MDASETLFSAASRGDLNELRRLVKDGADVNACDEDGLTPLCYAALVDQLAAARYLVAAGADPFLDSSRAFDTACGRDAAQVSGFLYALQTQSRPDHFGTPLHAAAILGLEDLLATCIAEGTDVNGRDHHGQTAVHMAFTEVYPHLVHRAQLVLEGGHPGFALPDRSPGLAQEAAARARRLAYGERLTWDPAVKDPLQIASVLVAHGADVNPEGGESPLSLAVRQGNLEAAKYLIANGADAAVEIAGRNLLHIAAHEGQAALIPYILDCGLSIDQRDISGWTPLHSAAWMGHIDAASVLVENGASKDIRNQQGRTPKGEAERRMASEETMREYLSMLDDEERDLRQRLWEQLGKVIEVLS
jgi:ankyrin repeat protein